MSDPFENVAPMPAPQRGAPSFPLIRADQLEIREPDFAVHGLFELGTLAMIFGPPGGGKSFLALDVACSVATASDFHGRRVRGGPVVVLAGEGYAGIKRRLMAWERQSGVSLDGAPLYISRGAANFLDAASVKAVVAAVDQVARTDGPPRIVMVDTVARAFGGGDENSTQDMGTFIAAVDDLKDRYPGCTVILVHHSGHGTKDRARGASALKAALDAEFQVEKVGEIVTLTNTKAKDMDPPSPIAFKLETIEIGTARDGCPITSAALNETNAPAKPKLGLSHNARLGFNAFEEAKRVAGKGGDLTADVELEEWRAVFYRRSTADEADSKRRAFNRARQTLVEIGALTVTDNRYRLARSPEAFR